MSGLVPHTYIYVYNRKGEPYAVVTYVCEHGVIMSECPEHLYGQQVEQHMVDWFNESFLQMRQRAVVRDRILGSTIPSR